MFRVENKLSVNFKPQSFIYFFVDKIISNFLKIYTLKNIFRHLFGPNNYALIIKITIIYDKSN